MVMILKLKTSDTFIGIEKSARKGSRIPKQKARRCYLQAMVISQSANTQSASSRRLKGKKVECEPIFSFGITEPVLSRGP